METGGAGKKKWTCWGAQVELTKKPRKKKKQVHEMENFDRSGGANSFAKKAQKGENGSAKRKR